MKKLLLLMLFLICASRVAAQDASNPLGGDIRASSTNCSVSSSCVWQKLPANATSLTVTVANGPVGSFTGTLQFEQSSNGGFNFSAASPASTTVPGVFTFTVTSFTDFRVRASAFASGDAAVNMQASGPATGPPGPTGPAGGSSVSPNSPVPAASQQGPAYNVRNYGAVGDAKSSRNCTTTNATGTITSTDNPWIAGDVGKKFQTVATSQSSFGTATGGNQNNEVTISAFNSAGSISVSPSTANQSATGTCVWYTQQDNVSMLAAYSAADAASTKTLEPGYSSPTLSHPGQVFMPKGGYVVCGSIYNDLLTHTGNNTEGVSLIGEPGTDIYVAPCFVPPAGATGSTGTLIVTYLNQRAEIGKFHINGMGMLAGGFSNNSYLVGALTSGKTWWHDITITDWGNSSTTSAAFGLNGGAGLSRIEGLSIQNSPVADKSTACFFDTVGVDIYSTFCSNHFINWQIKNSGQRTVLAPHFAIHGAQGDECGQIAGTGCAQLINSTVNCFGCEFLNPGGGTPSWSVDTQSSLYLTDSSAFTYNVDGGNSSAIVLAGNGQVFATGSNFSGNNTSAAISGPSSSKYIDMGGNQLFNEVAGVLTACTAANFGTCAFSGGIIPKATVTHTPNTCYAVTGNLLATAQNLCTFLNDQNYQVLNITAQSGGTTPANSACATPPVITLSDGTRTATLTMTTAKTQWSSAVDASTVNSVFASGTTLTISIGANTCATPPVNVAVSYVLQSVLNP